MGSRYMGHSHGNLSAEIPPLLIGLHLQMGFRDAVAFSLGESSGNWQEQLRMAVCRDMPGVLSALDGFDMAKPYPLSTLPRNALIPSRLIVSPKTEGKALGVSATSADQLPQFPQLPEEENEGYADRDADYQF